MRTTETALEERREVSHYLHDHLGQNLGYLHIKMDQLIMERDKLSLEKVNDDLEKMREAVNDSYEIIRGILETIHAETNTSLTDLLMEHAKKISQRANFKIDFKVRGKPIHLPTEVQRAIFYAFEESLSNAEKYAQASKIDILAEWGQDHFTVTISDNGIGFDPNSIKDGHFGMEILNERMAKVNGRVTLTTLENSGTVVNIHVPKPPVGPPGAGI
jgi:signal transduction histidine kinase